MIFQILLILKIVNLIHLIQVVLRLSFYLNYISLQFYQKFLSHFHLFLRKLNLNQQLILIIIILSFNNFYLIKTFQYFAKYYFHQILQKHIAYPKPILHYTNIFLLIIQPFVFTYFNSNLASHNSLILLTFPFHNISPQLHTHINFYKPMLKNT